MSGQQPGGPLGSQSRAGLRFSFAARMDLDQAGEHRKPEERARISIRPELEVGGEKLQELQEFIHRGHPQEPTHYPPTRTESLGCRAVGRSGGVVAPGEL